MTIETRYSVSENIIKYHQNSEICLIFKNCFPLIYTAVTIKLICFQNLHLHLGISKSQDNCTITMWNPPKQYGMGTFFYNNFIRTDFQVLVTGTGTM